MKDLVNDFKITLIKLGWGSCLIGFLLACALARQTPEPVPAGQQLEFDIQTATPTATIILELANAPTHTPDPNATPTPQVTATTALSATVEVGEEGAETSTSEAAAAETPTPETEAPASEVEAPTPTATVPAATAEPLLGGDWDFESDFIAWGNPYGEPCPGGAVASGWSAFVEQGQFGSSCFNENLYRPNVFSGAKSQEITFDFIAANSGIFRTIPSQPGHRYQIMAHAKHDHSLAVVEMFLGVDLTGGTVWNGESVQWFPWDDGIEDAWTVTEETVTATGESLTIFIRGVHPLAEQGGKTVIDNVSVIDLGP